MPKRPSYDASEELGDEDDEDEEVVIRLGELRSLASKLSKQWGKARSQTSKHLVAQQLRLAVEERGCAAMGDALALWAWREQFGADRGEFWRTAVWLLLGVDDEDFRRVSVIAKAIIDLEDDDVAPADTAQALGERGFDARARTPAKTRRRTTAARHRALGKVPAKAKSPSTRSKSKARMTKKGKRGGG